MSFFTRLPDLLLTDILRTWSSSKNLSRLDTAFTNNRTRHILLNLFRSDVFTLDTLPRNYHRWVNFRCIKVEHLSLIGDLPLSAEFEPILTRVKSVKLTDYKIRDTHHFLRVINNCTGMRFLQLNKMECLNCETVLSISEHILNQLTSMKIVNCLDCFIEGEAIEYIIKNTKSLFSLCLSRCGLSDWDALNRMFEQFNRLSEIAIYDTYTNDTHLQTLCYHNECSLTNLTLRNHTTNNLDSVIMLFNKCKKLVYLHLSDNVLKNTSSIHYESNKKITSSEPAHDSYFGVDRKKSLVLKTNAELDPINRELSVYGKVNGTRHDFYQLFSSVEATMNLNTLHIDGNGGAEINGSILSLFSERNPNLYEFQLTNCDSKTLADGLNDIMWQCQRLQDLRLKNCDASNKDLSGLLGIPNVLLKLTLVGFSALNIDTVRSIIQSNPQLRKLYLQDCVSSGDLDYLYEYIKDNRLRVDINDHKKYHRERMEADLMDG